MLAPVVIGLSLIAVVYIGLVALVQTDMKKLIAYSSISHMGFVTLGIFLFNDHGMEGAVMQMVSHGFVSGALFLCVGVLYDRMHSRLIADYGGVVNTMPVFAAFFMLFAMANCGLPGTSGFVGEFLVILGTMEENFWYAFAAASTLLFGAAYTLWMYQARRFRRGGQRPGCGSDGHRPGARGWCLGLVAIAVLAMGIVSAAFRRGAAHLGQRAAGAGKPEQIMRAGMRKRAEGEKQSAYGAILRPRPSSLTVMTYEIPDFLLAAPEIFLLTMVCVILVVDLFLSEARRVWTYALSQLSLVGTAVLVFVMGGEDVAYTFNGMFVDDPMADVLKICGLPRRWQSCWSTREPTSPRATCSAASSSCFRCSRRSA